MLEAYYNINQAIGININILSSEEILINVCGVNVEKNKLEIDLKIIDIKDVDDLKKFIPQKSFIALNLSGKGILQKQIGTADRINAQNFNAILPNASFDDFYIQNFISGEKSFVTVIRKTDADKWIELLKAFGFAPLLLSLGCYAVHNIESQLNVYDDEIVFDGITVLRNNQREWIEVKTNNAKLSPFPLKLETETIDEKLIIPYSCAFQLVLSRKIVLIQAEVNMLSENLHLTIANNRFKVMGGIILAIFFTSLLVNFVLLSNFTSENKKLSYQVERSNQSSSDVQEVNEKVKAKEKLLKALGWDNGVNKAVMVDELASLLPGDITLQEINFNPINHSEISTSKELSFFDGKIKITGNAGRIISVNEWMARVKTKKWVKNIQMESYAHDNDLNTGKFHIEIDF